MVAVSDWLNNQRFLWGSLHKTRQAKGLDSGRNLVP